MRLAALLLLVPALASADPLLPGPEGQPPTITAVALAEAAPAGLACREMAQAVQAGTLLWNRVQGGELGIDGLRAERQTLQIRFRRARSRCEGAYTELPRGLAFDVLLHQTQLLEQMWRALMDVFGVALNGEGDATVVNARVAAFDEQMTAWISWYERSQRFWAGEFVDDEAEPQCLSAAQRDLMGLGTELWSAAVDGLGEEAVEFRQRLTAASERAAACSGGTPSARSLRRSLDGLAAHYDAVIDAMVQEAAVELRSLQQAEQRLLARLERCKGEHADGAVSADCRVD